MTLILRLSLDEERRLQQLAAQQGKDAKEIALQAVKRLLPPITAEERVAALRTLLEDDEEEQRETSEYLQRVLDEDRLSYRKLYADETLNH